MAISLFAFTLILMLILVRAGRYTTNNWELWVIVLMMASLSKEVMENLP